MALGYGIAQAERLPTLPINSPKGRLRPWREFIFFCYFFDVLLARTNVVMSSPFRLVRTSRLSSEEERRHIDNGCARIALESEFRAGNGKALHQRLEARMVTQKSKIRIVFGATPCGHIRCGRLFPAG